MSKTIAIILARAGSKRLPGKNKLLLAGIPMISHTLRAAKTCTFIDKVLVSSDDLGIKEIAQSEGVDFYLRPDSLAHDKATSVDAMLDVLVNLKEKNEIYDNCVLLQPTSPLRNSKHITECLSQFLPSRAKSSISVTEVFPHPHYCYKQNDGQLISLKNEISLEEKILAPNGAIYAVRVSDFLKFKSFHIPTCLAFPMGKEESCDVDYLWEFKACEALLQKNRGETQ
jgi:CMP-N,N'-diacetyllegionaminic acid synthase